jgi:hypothetical protein
MISADGELDLWSRNARTRVQQEFLVFNQVKKWLDILKQFKTMAAPVRLNSDSTGAYSSVGHMDRTERVHYPIH